MLLGYFLKRTLLKALKMKVIVANSGCDLSTIKTRSGKATHKVKRELFVYRAFTANTQIIILLLFNIVPLLVQYTRQRLTKSVDTAGKKFFRTRSQPHMHRRTNLIVVSSPQ